MDNTSLPKRYTSQDQISQEITEYYAQDPNLYYNLERLKVFQDSCPHLKLSPSIICIIDLFSKKYLFVSENIYSTLGYSPQDLYQEGCHKSFSLIPTIQLKILVENVFPTMYHFFKMHHKTRTIEDLKISFTNILTHRNGTQKWYLQHITVVGTDENYNPQLLLNQITDINDCKTDNVINFSAELKDNTGIYQTIFKETFKCEEKNLVLSEREIEVLHLMIQGYSSREIAETLFISEHTVYKHRKNMLKKLEVKRAGDLIRKAIGEGII